jgi:hypothetical protein
MTALTDPGIVLNRLEAIENDLAIRQNSYEAAALAWFRAKREKEHARAVAFMKAEGTVAERQAQADIETARVGMQEEAEYEATRAVMRTLETRASIGQSVLRSQARS